MQFILSLYWHCYMIMTFRHDGESLKGQSNSTVLFLVTIAVLLGSLTWWLEGAEATDGFSLFFQIASPVIFLLMVRLFWKGMNHLILGSTIIDICMQFPIDLANHLLGERFNPFFNTLSIITLVAVIVFFVKCKPESRPANEG